MNKVIEALYNLAENGDDRAAKHLMNMETLGGEQLAQYVAENDTELQEILGLNTSIMSNPDEFDKSLQDAYYALRNTGVTAYTGDKKTDIYGRPMHSLDEFMGEFGMAPNDSYSISDDDRAFFTNPKHPNYWKNRPENERAAIARKMGFADVRELDDYLDREAKDFQHRQAVEGYDENNEATRWWIPSAISGIFTPRVKEAKLAGRPVGTRDVVGDVAENAVSMVPGFGSTKLLTRGAARLPAGKVASMVEKAVPVVGATVDQVAQPLASQALDAGILYNPSLAGSPEDTLNLRSEFSPGEVAGQVGGIIGAKGAIKGGAGIAKNFLETRYGNKAGGEGFRGLLGIVENVNEKTDDLIARRQAVLDRKAELAKRRENVSLPGDRDLPNLETAADVSDLQKAETFRILNSEAERLANSNASRKAYRKAFANDDIWNNLATKDIQMQEKLLDLGEVVPENFAVDPTKFHEVNLGSGYKLIIPASTDIDVVHGLLREKQLWDEELARIKNTPEGQAAAAAAAAAAAGEPGEMRDELLRYITENEDAPIKGQLIQLPDGNIVKAGWMKQLPNGEAAVRYPGADYDVVVNGKPRGLQYQYETTFDPSLGGFRKFGDNLSRNQAVYQKIKEDDLLKRKLDPKLTAWKENARDVLANDAFNIMAREGVGGVTTATDLRGKRERARWNSMLGKLRTITADPAIPIEERRRNADAIMNVMQYGLDGLPAELYMQSPETYHRIAKELKIDDWKHYTETNPQPTPSSSRTK